MSDLIYLFGNENDILSPKSNVSFQKDCDYVKNKAQRPNTLKTKKEFNNNTPLHNGNNGIKFKNISKFPLTPANVSIKLFDNFTDSPISLHGSLSCSDLSNLPNALPPENADGNIEYKRQLLNLTPLRMQHLITQLKWRLAEGEGQAIYEIGVDDDGKVSGLEQLELLESVKNLCKMAESLNASVSILRECTVGSRKALEILIRKLPTHFSTHETRVAVLGNMDAGKSTLIGVLTQGILDNGQGKTRLATFRHVHEVRSGRTSSISCQLLGFDSDQNLFNFYWQKNRLHQRSHEEVVLSSSKLVALIDLAGYHKYQRTTLFALTARRPHFVLLVIPANHGFKGTSIDHCQFAITLGVPIAVVVTKIDRCPPDDAVSQLAGWLMSRCVQSAIVTISSVSGARQAAANMGVHRSIPVFPVSCVSGTGIDILTAFLGMLQTTEELSKHHQAEVWIDQIHYEVPRVDGCVVVGLVYTGLVDENVCLYLGPQKDGHFVPVTVQSIHRNRVQQTTVENGQYASFAVCLTTYDAIPDQERFKWIPGSPTTPEEDIAEHCVRRGMVLLAQPPAATTDVYNYVCRPLTAESRTECGCVVWGVVISGVRMLDDQHVSLTHLHKQQGSWIVHCGNVYQKCEMLNLESARSRRYNIADVVDISPDDLIFQFKLLPQFVHAHYPVVFHRAGQTIKACGNIKLVLGSHAFQTRDLNPHGQQRQEPISHFFSFDHIESLTSQRTGAEEAYSDDEYVTAPSSPILSE